jgi:hypothetical protein
LKASRYNKVLGLAIGEKSIIAAEVSGGSARPDAKRLAEFSFPPGISLQDPVALGTALAEFLRENEFSAKSAVIGLPAKWLLVKTKEVPPADKRVAADMLRLQAEGEFSSELKELVFDYAGEPSTAGARSVLLVATPQKYLDLANQLCEAAKLTPIAITSSSAALGAVVGRSGGKNAVVLSLASGGAELTAQSGGHTSALRHLRAPSPEPLFISELRRAVSMLPLNGSTGMRELIVWDGGATEPAGLGESLGMKVRSGDLPSLGVTASEAARNGGGRKYAAAVSLAVSGLGDRSLPVDFLHSRLAAPKKSPIARWMIWAAAGALLLVVTVVLAYQDFRKKQAALNQITTELTGLQPRIKSAQAFVNKVTFAQGWHGEDARYLSFLRDITELMPDDEGQTFATDIDIREKEVPRTDTQGKIAAPKVGGDARNLLVTFSGKAPNPKAALKLNDLVTKKRDRFTDVKPGGIQSTGKAGEVMFSFTCTYMPPEQKPK